MGAYTRYIISYLNTLDSTNLIANIIPIAELFSCGRVLLMIGETVAKYSLGMC